MLTVLAIFIVIGSVIFFHELGHFTFAKLTGMRVERFSIGFPPRLIGKQIGDTDYCLSAIPLGGYVKVSGVIDESMDAVGIQGEPWEFQSKNTLQKILFITGGVIFNFLLSILIFSGITLSTGIYTASDEPLVSEVIPGLPADSIGIQSGDRIRAVNGTETPTWSAMTDIIHSLPGEVISLRWQRDDQIFEIQARTLTNKILNGSKLTDVGMVGISPVLTHRRAGIIEAIGRGTENTWYWLKITVISLKMVVTGEESIRNIGGPIFIARLAGESAKSGFASLIGLIAIISVNLGMINILPIPALDGGHLIVTILEAIIRRPLSLKAKMRIQQVGLALILMLTVLVFYNDIARLIRGF